MRAASLAAVIAVLALAGCGGGGATSTSGPPTTTTSTSQINLTPLEKQGKAVFITACGACHELADAGTSGTAGPALTTPLSAAHVRLVLARGQGLMEPNVVTGQRAAAIAAYVAAATK